MMKYQDGAATGEAITVRPREPGDDRAAANLASVGQGPEPDDLVNRHLGAGVYLQGAYADHVARVLLRPSPRALCPPWGVDAAWLARHAAEARRLRRERDAKLALALAGAAAATA